MSQSYSEWINALEVARLRCRKIGQETCAHIVAVCQSRAGSGPTTVYRRLMEAQRQTWREVTAHLATPVRPRLPWRSLT